MQKIGIILLFFFSSVSGFSQGAKEGSLRRPADPKTFYFREWSVNNMINKWFSSMLYGLQEPVLSSYSGTAEIYRFTCLRSFDHPFSVRVMKNGKNIMIISKMCDGAGGYTPGPLITADTTDVSESDFRDFISLLDKAGFGDMPAQKQSWGKDGAEWIMEGVRDGKYHFAYRWSPNEERDTEFRDACMNLLQLSSLKIHKKDMY